MKTGWTANWMHVRGRAAAAFTRAPAPAGDAGRRAGRLGIGLALAAAAAAGLVVSCATIDQVVVAPPLIPGAKYVGMDTCAACHEKEVRDFPRSAHARITIPGEGERVEGQGCESCHGPGSLHLEDGSGKFIVNPGKNPEGCFQCHLATKAEFSLQYHHPVREGRMSCNDCHDPHGHDLRLPKGRWVARVNDTCARCHREQARPHVYEHEAMREGCTACHAPHGSLHDKMLVERDNNLCLKCHAQVVAPGAAARSVYVGKMDHTQLLSQGTCFSAGCHTAVHGSSLNPHLRY